MLTVDIIRKINKNIVHEDGTIDTFDQQLVDFVSGDFELTYPFVLCENTDSLNYVDHVDSSKPLVMRVNTVLKIRNKHHLRLSEVSKSVQYLNESLIAFESLTEKDSVVIVLEKLVHNTLVPYVITVRYDKKVGYSSVNEITSF